MVLPPWFWLAMLVLVMWGAVGILQKLSTNYISAESSLIWLVVGFFLVLPWLYPGKVLFTYSWRSLTWAIVSGFLNALGAWALFAAMKSGGKASIVVPFTALYPVVVAIAAPIFLHESLTLLQGAGIVCALVAGFLLST